MLDILLLAIGVVGFSMASYWDLRYTEFPDWLPYSMLILVICSRAGFAFLTGDWFPLLSSTLIGLAFLGIGLLMYAAKQWGDGDAWLLGALGFVLPGPSG